MDTAKVCQHCGKPLSSKAVHGLCPECFLKVGLGSGVAPEGGTPKPTGFVPPRPEELAAHFPQLEILELLGKGGMGAVYKARQKGLDRLVALKVLPPDSGRDPAFAERFTREAQALARLNHPNIVGVHEFGQAGEFYFFVMEFVDGVNLRQMLRAHRLSPREAMAIVPQICEALQYAHDHGIVHRDIKPENVLVDKLGRVKIADFGLAKLLGKEPDGEPLTRSAEVMGTPQYMAPEQLEKPLEVDHRVDIYSLGVVFYEMLTGELPLGRFAAPSKKVHIDVRLDEIVLRALEKEPDLRYQQANALKTQVETLASNTSPAPTATPVVEAKDFSDHENRAAATGSSPPWSATKKAGVFALGCGGLIIAGIAVLVAWGAWRLQSARTFSTQQVRERQREFEAARASSAQAAADIRLAFGPVIERVIQSRETGTNVFLNLDTGDLLTPPPEITSTLSAAREGEDRSWRALDIPQDSNRYRYIAWLGETGADLMGEPGERIVGFGGLFARAHGIDSTHWDDWNNLTPQQVVAATEALAWGRRAAEAARLKMPLPPGTQTGGNYASAEQLETQSPGGPIVNLLTRAQSVTWFFQTREGTCGVLQILGRSENPPGVKVCYRQLLSNRYTAIEHAALQNSLHESLVRLRDLQTTYTDRSPPVQQQREAIERIQGQIATLSNPTPLPTSNLLDQPEEREPVSTVPQNIVRQTEPTPVLDQPTEIGAVIERLIRRAQVRTGYLFELWEKVPGVSGEYRIRDGVRRISVPMRTGRPTLESPRAEVFYLVASNRYYIQCDPLGASTLHYYGPFEGDPWRTLPIPGRSAEELAHDLATRLEAAKSITAFTERDAAMSKIAVDAARAGETTVAKKAVHEIVAFTSRDNAAHAAARELAKNGHRAEALEIARTITSFVTRDAVLRELAE